MRRAAHALLGAVILVASAPGRPAAEDQRDSRVLGREAYEMYCSSCHGETAEGDGPFAGALSSPPPNLDGAAYNSMSDEEFAELINNGDADRDSPFMPNWKSILDDHENAAVIQYIRGLRKRAVKK